MRRIAADASAPDCRTMSCQADSPFELLTWMFQRPAIDGMFRSPTSTAVKRFAWNGYGAPRVPRVYWPSSRPSLNVASTFVPYSSKLNVSAPFENCPVVDVTLSSPLKNDPFGVAHAAPPQTISKRNGMSRRTGSAPAGAVLTSTDASHNPAG